jgi:hypothetical protein
VAHSPEVRAGVVAALITGARLCDVCKEFNVPQRTAMQWRDDAIASSALVREVRDVVRDNGEIQRTRRELDLEDLVGRLVSSSIEALVAQAGHAAERDWFASQSASGIAEYRGVEFDRLIRLLRAFQRDTQPERSDGDIIDGEATG